MQPNIEAFHLLNQMIIIKESKLSTLVEKHDKEISDVKKTIILLDIAEVSEDLRRYKQLIDLNKKQAPNWSDN